MENQIEVITYEQERLNYFTDLMEKAQRRYRRLFKRFNNAPILSEEYQMMNDAGRQSNFHCDVVEMLENSSHKQEWISVEERLPEVCGMPVLMVAVNPYSQTRVVKGFTDYQCPITFHTNEREYDGTWRAWKVTHWMPLPEPPKGE